jgi:DNA replication protein DnaC
MTRREVSPELRRALKTLRLGKLLDTLPERLRMARDQKLDPEDVLLTLLTDETQRRAQQRHRLRAREAGLLADLVFDRWDLSANIQYDRRMLDELRCLSFIEQHHHVLIIGPVGVGKTMLAHSLGQLAIAREYSVHCEPAEKLLHRLRACRLDGTHERELRRLIQVDLLIVDDLALRAMDAHETSDLHAIVCGRHQTASMVVTSNRDPSEWLALLADPLQAQALADRFVNNAYDLVIEGESYRKRQKPQLGVARA